MKKAAVALLALACNMFLDAENDLFYEDPYDSEDLTISGHSTTTTKARTTVQLLLCALCVVRWMR